MTRRPSRSGRLLASKQGSFGSLPKDVGERVLQVPLALDGEDVGAREADPWRQPPREGDLGPPGELPGGGPVAGDEEVHVGVGAGEGQQPRLPAQAEDDARQCASGGGGRGDDAVVPQPEHQVVGQWWHFRL